MREIKFRGKRLDNGEWVDGDLHFRTPFPHIHSEIDYSRVNIDPHTVGQFTGLHDKNGKEIYEGDIVVLRRRTKNLGDIQTIEWCSHVAAFTRVTDGDDAHFISAADMALYEVIGNIYDNPELLKTE